MYNNLNTLKVNPEYVAEKYHEGERYLVKGRTIYQVCYSENAGYYAIRLWCKGKQGVPLVNAGHYIMTTAKHANALAGFELLNGEA